MGSVSTVEQSGAVVGGVVLFAVVYLSMVAGQ